MPICCITTSLKNKFWHNKRFKESVRKTILPIHDYQRRNRKKNAQLKVIVNKSKEPTAIPITTNTGTIPTTASTASNTAPTISTTSTLSESLPTVANASTKSIVQPRITNFPPGSFSTISQMPNINMEDEDNDEDWFSDNEEDTISDNINNQEQTEQNKPFKEWYEKHLADRFDFLDIEGAITYNDLKHYMACTIAMGIRRLPDYCSH